MARCSRENRERAVASLSLRSIGSWRKGKLGRSDIKALLYMNSATLNTKETTTDLTSSVFYILYSFVFKIKVKLRYVGE